MIKAKEARKLLPWATKGVTTFIKEVNRIVELTATNSETRSIEIPVTNPVLWDYIPWITQTLQRARYTVTWKESAEKRVLQIRW